MNLKNNHLNVTDPELHSSVYFSETNDKHRLKHSNLIHLNPNHKKTSSHNNLSLIYSTLDHAKNPTSNTNTHFLRESVPLNYKNNSYDKNSQNSFYNFSRQNKKNPVIEEKEDKKINQPNLFLTKEFKNIKKNDKSNKVTLSHKRLTNKLLNLTSSKKGYKKLKKKPPNNCVSKNSKILFLKKKKNTNSNSNSNIRINQTFDLNNFSRNGKCIIL